MDQYSQNETGVGVGGTIGRIAMWNAALRGGQNRRALLYGPKNTIAGQGFRNFGRSALGIKATDDELIRRRARNHFGSLGSPMSMSGISAGASILEGGDGKYTRQVTKLWAPASHVSPLNSVDSLSGGGILGIGSNISKYESNLGSRYYTATSGGGRVGTPYNLISPGRYHAGLAGAERYDVVDRLMGLGVHKGNWDKMRFGGAMSHGFGKSQLSAADFVVGSMVKPGGSSFNNIAGKGLGNIGNYAKYVASRGSAIRKGGSLATKATLSTGGKIAAHLVPGVQFAVLAKDIYDIAKLGTEGVYNLGEAYFWKLPKRFYQETNRTMTREVGMGASGTTFISQTASNRARAVQAIQGSRLNARSALGNEAGLLAGHFG